MQTMASWSPSRATKWNRGKTEREKRGWARRETDIPVLIAWLTRLTHQSASPSVFHPSVVNLLLTPPSIATHSHSHFLCTFFLLTHSHTARCRKGVFLFFLSPKEDTQGRGSNVWEEKRRVCVVLSVFSKLLANTGHGLVLYCSACGWLKED